MVVAWPGGWNTLIVMGELRWGTAHQEFCLDHIKCEFLERQRNGNIRVPINVYNLELTGEVLVQSRYTVHMGLLN